MDFESSLYFVGRRAEQALWSEYLADPQGNVVLIVGDEGTGKSALVDQIILQAWHEANLYCGYVRYDADSMDTPESLMRYMLEEAFHSARASAGAIDAPGLRFWQWDAFFDGIKIRRRRMKEIHHLVHFLRFDPQKNIAEQFIGRLQKIVSLMPSKSRAIFLIDYNGAIPDEFVLPWMQVAKNLPPQVKFVFSQEPDNAFLRNAEFMSLPQVKTIPCPVDNGSGKKGLRPLTDEDFDDLLSHFSFPPDRGDLKQFHKRYADNLYMVRAAFDLMQTNSALTVDSFPNEPNPDKLARQQWEQLASLGPEVVQLFRAYAFLEVTVPDEVAMLVAEIDWKTFKKTLDIPYVRKLICSRPDGHQIADQPLLRCVANDSRTEPPFGEPADYHRRAIAAFDSLTQRSLMPDAFAASRIPEHVLAIGGPYAFARSVCDVMEHLLPLCHFDTALRLIERALEKVDPHDKEAGQLHYKIGCVYLQQGNKEEAKKIFIEAAGILKKLEDLDTLPDVLLTQGLFAIDEKQMTDAYHLLEEACQYYMLNDDPQGLVDASIPLGKALWRLGRRQEGEKVLLDALETAKRIEYSRQMLRSQAGIYCMLGTLFEELGEHEKAAVQYYKALDLTQEIYDRALEALVYANMRGLLEAIDDLKKAEEYEQKSLTIHKELGNLEAVAFDHTNLACLAEKMGEPSKMKAHLLQAKELYLQFGNQEKASECELRMTND